MTMNTDRILERLSGTKESLETYNATSPGNPVVLEDITALEAAISMISTLQDECVTDAQALKDLIFDYNLAVKQNNENHRKFETAAKPVKRDSVWHCPECNHRVAPRHSFCHWCGKKLGWG